MIPPVAAAQRDRLAQLHDGAIDVARSGDDFPKQAMGIVFQVPMGILALTKLGVTTPRQLAKNRRYAYLILAIVAMALPGTDPVTMLVELVPLLLLYELSIVLARAFGGPIAARRAAHESSS